MSETPHEETGSSEDEHTVTQEDETLADEREGDARQEDAPGGREGDETLVTDPSAPDPHVLRGDSTFESIGKETTTHGDDLEGKPYPTQEPVEDRLQQPVGLPAHVQGEDAEVEGATGTAADAATTHTSTGRPPGRGLVDQKIDEHLGNEENKKFDAESETAGGEEV